MEIVYVVVHCYRIQKVDPYNRTVRKTFHSYRNMLSIDFVHGTTDGNILLKHVFFEKKHAIERYCSRNLLH